MLKMFVDSLRPYTYIDKDGNFLINEDDHVLTKTCFIDTYNLVRCQTQDGDDDLLRELFKVIF